MRKSTLIVAALASVFATLVGPGLSTAAQDRTTVDDLSVRVNFGPPRGFLETTTRELLNTIEFDVAADSGAPQTITLRFSLPEGLAFASDVPDSSEGCTNGTPVVCTDMLDQPGSGTWGWPIVASARGTYAITATVEGARPDPNPANNSYTFRFEIKPVVPPVSVYVSAVKLKPAKPKAGSIVAATSVVKANGAPVKPSKVLCSGTLGGKKIAGTPKALTGAAQCRYRTPKSAKGKKLSGSVKVTARGKTITKRFSTKLG